MIINEPKEDKTDKSTPSKVWLYRSLFILLILATSVTWLAVSASRPSGKLLVSFLDVGQGDGILIESPTGRRILIDTGPDKTILRELGDSLPWFDRRIDMIIETHPDGDHVGGAVDVLKNYRVLALVESGLLGKDPSYLASASLSQNLNLARLRPATGSRIDLGGGARLEFLYVGATNTSATNDSSLVARLDYGKNSFLFVGDAPAKLLSYLSYRQSDKLKADVYKVAHHGSRNSLDERFLSLVSPAYSVISVGKNKFGHPHQEILDALRKVGSQIWRTDEKGRVTFVSDGQQVGLAK